MKILFRILVFVLLSNSVFAQGIDLSEESDKKNTLWRLGLHANYFNHNNSLGYLEIDRDFRPGLTFGPIFNWKITSYNLIRLEPYYMFQHIQNRFDGDNLKVRSTFNNHALEMDFFPNSIISNSLRSMSIVITF